MGVTKQTKRHGDPLLLEVVKGLEKTLSCLQEEKEPRLVAVRGVGERHLQHGDPLLTESVRYHQSEHDRVEVKARSAAQHESLLKRNKYTSLFDSADGAIYDPILQEYVIPHSSLDMLKALEEDIGHKCKLFRELSERKKENLLRHGVAPHESLLKRTKGNSLFASHCGAFYDPILQEYMIPRASASELHALKEDIAKKYMLFLEMSARKRKNLDDNELYCDQLVHRYRIQDIMLRGKNKTLEPTTFAVKSKFRKLAQGDPLLAATLTTKHKVEVPAVPCAYRKLNKGDPMLKDVQAYHVKTNAKTAVPCFYREVHVGGPLLVATME
jgi:hypothetical protein